MGPSTASMGPNAPPFGPPPPIPSAALTPSTTRQDRGPSFQATNPLPRQGSLDMSERLSDKLSDVASDDLDSIPDDLSPRSSGGGSAKNVRIAPAPARGGRAKKQKTGVGAKVITI